MRLLISCLAIGAELIVHIRGTAAEVDRSKLPPPAAVQTDFQRDIQPLLERSCLPCHSEPRPKAHFRLDFREGLIKGGNSHQEAVVPGDSGASPLVHNIAGLVKEMEMPPLEKRDRYPAMTPGELALIRAWIDQGAQWPQGLTLKGERPLAGPAEAAAQATAATKLDPLFEQIRQGDRKSIAQRLRDRACLNLRDEDGNTPLIQAAFYLDARVLAWFLNAGADPNAANDAGVTALMKAVWDVDKTRLLLQHHAEVNAASLDKNTPLIIASYTYGTGKVVKELLAHGADIDRANHAKVTPTRAAAEAGDVEVLRLLLDHEGDPNSAGLSTESGQPVSALMIAAQLGHLDCVKLLLARGANINLDTGHGNALAFAVFTGRRDVVRFLLDHGSDVNMAGRRLTSFRRDTGFTPLMYAALNEHNDPTVVRWLLERGASVHAQSSTGDTALGLARLRGHTKIVEALLEAGAGPEPPAQAETPPVPLWTENQAAAPTPQTLRKAAEAGVSLLLKSSARLSEATGNRCFTCHEHAKPTLAWNLARSKGWDYPQDLAQASLDNALRASRRRTANVIQEPLPVPAIPAWFLVGLNAAGYPADTFTDNWAYSLARHQYGDGRWATRAARAPTDYSDVTSTALAIRALNTYAPPTMRAAFAARTAKAARWLRRYHPASTEEQALQLLGLLWAGDKPSELAPKAKALLHEQRPDGGWAQIATLDSDAYATGLALFTLYSVGALKPAEPAYQRGARFLLARQCDDGSWFVRTRTSPVQVAIENIFPHGKDQWISSDATAWACMALMCYDVSPRIAQRGMWQNR